ncbi:MAG: hypothetical protein AAGI68_09980 [Planctomycetota bacterium]
MTYAVLLVCIGLAVGALIAFIVAYGLWKDGGGAADASARRKQGALLWLGGGVGAVGLAVLVFILAFMPMIVGERIAEAEELTRETFRDKIGREPDTLTFDRTNRKSGDGWRYRGVAEVGGEVWDVTVTRSNDRASGKTTLSCEAVPRD